MWIWEDELRQIGLRRLSPHYWQGEGRYGLPATAYLSVFCNAVTRARSVEFSGRERIDVSAFHVTFLLGVDRIHFYFHEAADNAWEPGGHTSSAEIRRYRREPSGLRAVADRVAAEFVAALGMTLMPRD